MANWFEKFLGTFGYVRSSAQNEIMRAVVEMAQSDPVPPATGRSSIEETANVFGRMGEFLQQFNGLDPVVPFDLLEYLTRIAPINPDINHATINLINLANNGHTLNIEAASDSVIEKAHARLNDRAKNIYPRSAGVDGLINHYIDQIAVTGAISSEDVLTPALDGVQRVVIVPTPRIRFKLLDGEYKPFQFLRTGEMIELNDLTYSYYAWRTIENSPYAVPMYLAALDPILTQRDMTKNIKFIVRKLGLLGIVALSLMAPPRKGSESDKEHTARKQKYLDSVLSSLRENYFQGLMVKYADQTLEHHNVTGDARGSKEIWDMNEQQIASGMGKDPLMIGRVYSSTETFANVTYMFMIRECNNVRRLPKRRMERTYSLDLKLQGIAIDALSFQFNENPARDPLAEAQAQETRERAVIKKAEVGMISPDAAAQELGYEMWDNPERLFSAQPANNFGLQRKAYRFRYNRELSKYEFLRERLMVSRSALASEAEVREILAKFQKKYLRKIEKFLGNATDEAIDVLMGFIRRSRLSDFSSADDFAQKAFGVLSPIYVDAFASQEAQNVVKAVAKDTYEFYRLEDKASFTKTPAVTFTMDAIDRRTLTFVNRLDRFYLSKYIFNEQTEKQVFDFLKDQFIQNGENIFFRTSDEAIRMFQSLAVDTLEGLTEYESTRIINTSVQRMRNWANIGQLNEAGFEYALVHNPDPEAPICVYMVGELIPMGIARQAVNELSQLSPDGFQARLEPVTEDKIRAQGIDGATRSGIGFPPYHPNCKTRLIATEKRPE